MEDLVEYQELGKDKLKSVKGVSSADGDADGDGSGWNWRGSSIIKIASSRWEILGWGGAEEEEEVNEEVEWVVTFFFKTAFTPVGMNVYCRNAEGIPPQLARRIREQLLEMEDCRTGRSRMRTLCLTEMRL